VAGVGVQKGAAMMESPPICDTCGTLLEWEDCEYCCDGYAGHDCGEDSCCCEFPDDNVLCDVCRGDAGWWSCPNASAHPEVMP
jgi:hypothetical protein